MAPWVSRGTKATGLWRFVEQPEQLGLEVSREPEEPPPEVSRGTLVSGLVGFRGTKGAGSGKFLGEPNQPAPEVSRESQWGSRGF